MISKGHGERLAKNVECVIGASVVYVTVDCSTVEYSIVGCSCGVITYVGYRRLLSSLLMGEYITVCQGTGHYILTL